MKLKTILTTAILTTVITIPAFAFSQIEGKVTDVRENEVIINTENGNYSILLEEAAILKNKALTEAEKIEEGDKLVVVYEPQTFAPAIYPPRKIAHTAIVIRSEKETDKDEIEETKVLNMLNLLPYYARGNNQSAIQILEDIIDTNYYIGLEILDDILNI